MITGFQLKAAKATLGIMAKDIAYAIDIHPATIIRLCNTKNLEPLPCSTKNTTALTSFFKKHGISFNKTNIDNCITYEVLENKIDSTEKMTRFQLKAARIATNLTQEQLSACIKISSSSLSLVEGLKNKEYIKAPKIDVAILKQFFERLGIIFPDDLSVALKKDPTLIAKKQKIS